MLLQPRIAQLQVLTSQHPSQETDESRCTYDEDPTLGSHPSKRDRGTVPYTNSLGMAGSHRQVMKDLKFGRLLLATSV
ncbi:unnamed protein product [Aspergillus oryzae]|nr:unnamed protein product [Aspergillus oryzae]